MGQGQGQISGAQQTILGARLCRVQQRAKKSRYQSEVFVCESTYRADAVDRLLILEASIREKFDVEGVP